MDLNKADLILHPARLQILMALAEGPATTQELAGRLQDVPKSSIYRHMRALLDGGMVAVAEARPVKGTLEKAYQLAQAPHLGPDDVAGFTRADHLRYFAMFQASQLQGFANYLEASPKPDLAAERAGYSEVVFSATPAQLDELLTRLRQLLAEYAQPGPGEGRQRHKIAIITHPFNQGDKNNG